MSMVAGPRALLVCLALVVSGCVATTLDSVLLKELKDSCPQVHPQVLESTSLSGWENAGNKSVHPTARSLSACVSVCCKKAKCSLALLEEEVCVTFECHGAEDCKLTPRNGSQAVVVREMSDAEWVLPPSNNKTHMEAKQDDNPKDSLSKDINSLTLPSNNASAVVDKRCEVGLRECGKHGVCVPLGNRRRSGQCQCNAGYKWESTRRDCVADGSAGEGESTTLSSNTDTSTPAGLENASKSSPTPPPVAPATTTTTTTTDSTQGLEPTSLPSERPMEKLVVNINNKTVDLAPGSKVYEGKVTLSAYAIGGTSDNKYRWILLQQPNSDNHGSVSDSSSQTITLSHLTQGVYVFKVIVDTATAHGEAVGNVTVNPAKHINQPPKAIIVSPSQEIKLPTSGVVIDGSGSTDDEEVVSYHWEMVTAPLGYTLKLSEQAGPTLQLTDLIPGNYTIMLRVKDKEGLEGNATTRISVIKETDYPPTANAGGDQIIYLPQTETILCGNTSTDDHGIEEWEWTKGPKDSGKAVDMQDTRTPFLHLSTLEEGHYQFILRVTDSIGQSSNTSVYVYVQKPNLAAPQANAGADLQIVLPNTTVLLDGSGSTDTAVSTHWLWSQLRGPNTAHLTAADQARVNASGLTKGEYQFMLTVWSGDDPSKNTSDTVIVTVKQDQNVAPVANAGGDFSVTLPVTSVVVDGSRSSDDVAVTRWLWRRDAASLAAGQVINGSDHSPVLIFAGVVAGRYVWKLTVWDDQGASSSDTVSIIVQEGRHHLDEVTVVVGGDMGTLSTLQLTTLLQKLELFLHSAERVVTIHLISLTGLPHSGRVSVTFLAQAGQEVVPGTEVVAMLRHQVLSDSSDLLDLPLISVDTVVCQNDCSGHGECVEASRECHCHTWWMESFFRRHMGDGLQNCDWSVVYVFVTICLVVVAMGLVSWGTVVLVARRLRGGTRPRRKPPRYFPLNTHDESFKIKTRPPGSLLDTASESNSDVEVHFDSRMLKHKAEKPRNGYHKLPRIRT